MPRDGVAQAKAEAANDELDKLEGSVQHFSSGAKYYGDGEAFLLPFPEDEALGLRGDLVSEPYRDEGTDGLPTRLKGCGYSSRRSVTLSGTGHAIRRA